MKIEITGEPKEIAALVLAVQERQGKAVVETTDRAGNVVAEAEKKSQPTGEGIKCKTFLETLASFGLTTGKLSCYQRPQPL